MDIRFNKVDNRYNIYIDNLCVGGIDYTETKNRIIINSILIDFKHRGKGYGRMVVEHMKSGGKMIVGDSAPLSIGFWKAVGAVFEFNINETNNAEIYRLLDAGVFPSFSI